MFYETDMLRPDVDPSVHWYKNFNVTFELPRSAAKQLRDLAVSGDARLKEIGILKVQVRELGDASLIQRQSGFYSQHDNRAGLCKRSQNENLYIHRNDLPTQSYINRQPFIAGQVDPWHYISSPPQVVVGSSSLNSPQHLAKDAPYFKESYIANFDRGEIRTKIIGISRGVLTEESFPIDVGSTEYVPLWLVESSLCISFRKHGRCEVACQTGSDKMIYRPRPGSARFEPKTRTPATKNELLLDSNGRYKVYSTKETSFHHSFSDPGPLPSSKDPSNTQCSSESILILESLANSLVTANEKAEKGTSGDYPMSKSPIGRETSKNGPGSMGVLEEMTKESEAPALAGVFSHRRKRHEDDSRKLDAREQSMPTLKHSEYETVTSSNTESLANSSFAWKSDNGRENSDMGTDLTCSTKKSEGDSKMAAAEGKPVATSLENLGKPESHEEIDSQTEVRDMAVGKELLESYETSTAACGVVAVAKDSEMNNNSVGEEKDEKNENADDTIKVQDSKQNFGSLSKESSISKPSILKIDAESDFDFKGSLLISVNLDSDYLKGITARGIENKERQLASKHETTVEEADAHLSTEEEVESPSDAAKFTLKRKRGRPPKSGAHFVQVPVKRQEKRKRGRPLKHRPFPKLLTTTLIERETFDVNADNSSSLLEESAILGISVNQEQGEFTKSGVSGISSTSHTQKGTFSLQNMKHGRGSKGKVLSGLVRSEKQQGQDRESAIQTIPSSNNDKTDHLINGQFSKATKAILKATESYQGREHAKQARKAAHGEVVPQTDYLYNPGSPNERSVSGEMEIKVRSRSHRWYQKDSIHRDIEEQYNRSYPSVACETEQFPPEDVYYGENYPIIFADDDQVALKFVDMSTAFKLAMKEKRGAIPAPSNKEERRSKERHKVLIKETKLKEEFNTAAKETPLTDQMQRMKDVENMKAVKTQSTKRKSVDIRVDGEFTIDRSSRKSTEDAEASGKPFHGMSLRPRRVATLREGYLSSDSYDDDYGDTEVDTYSSFESDESSDSEPLINKVRKAGKAIDNSAVVEGDASKCPVSVIVNKKENREGTILSDNVVVSNINSKQFRITASATTSPSYNTEYEALPATIADATQINFICDSTPAAKVSSSNSEKKKEEISLGTVADDIVVQNQSVIQLPKTSFTNDLSTASNLAEEPCSPKSGLSQKSTLSTESVLSPKPALPSQNIFPLKMGLSPKSALSQNEGSSEFLTQEPMTSEIKLNTEHLPLYQKPTDVAPPKPTISPIVLSTAEKDPPLSPDIPIFEIHKAGSVGKGASESKFKDLRGNNAHKKTKDIADSVICKEEKSKQQDMNSNKITEIDEDVSRVMMYSDDEDRPKDDIASKSWTKEHAEMSGADSSADKLNTTMCPPSDSSSLHLAENVATVNGRKAVEESVTSNDNIYKKKETVETKHENLSVLKPGSEGDDVIKTMVEKRQTFDASSNKEGVEEEHEIVTKNHGLSKSITRDKDSKLSDFTSTSKQLKNEQRNEAVNPNEKRHLEGAADNKETELKGDSLDGITSKSSCSTDDACKGISCDVSCCEKDEIMKPEVNAESNLKEGETVIEKNKAGGNPMSSEAESTEGSRITRIIKRSIKIISRTLSKGKETKKKDDSKPGDKVDVHTDEGAELPKETDFEISGKKNDLESKKNVSDDSESYSAKPEDKTKGAPGTETVDSNDDTQIETDHVNKQECAFKSSVENEGKKISPFASDRSKNPVSQVIIIEADKIPLRTDDPAVIEIPLVASDASTFVVENNRKQTERKVGTGNVSQDSKINQSEKRSDKGKTPKYHTADGQNQSTIKSDDNILLSKSVAKASTDANKQMMEIYHDTAHSDPSLHPSSPRFDLEATKDESSKHDVVSSSKDLSRSIAMENAATTEVKLSCPATSKRQMEEIDAAECLLGLFDQGHLAPAATDDQPKIQKDQPLRKKNDSTVSGSVEENANLPLKGKQDSEVNENSNELNDRGILKKDDTVKSSIQENTMELPGDKQDPTGGTEKQAERLMEEPRYKNCSAKGSIVDSKDDIDQVFSEEGKEKDNNASVSKVEKDAVYGNIFESLARERKSPIVSEPKMEIDGRNELASDQTAMTSQSQDGDRNIFENIGSLKVDENVAVSTENRKKNFNSKADGKVSDPTVNESSFDSSDIVAKAGNVEETEVVVCSAGDSKKDINVPAHNGNTDLALNNMIAESSQHKKTLESQSEADKKSTKDEKEAKSIAPSSKVIHSKSVLKISTPKRKLETQVEVTDGVQVKSPKLDLEMLEVEKNSQSTKIDVEAFKGKDEHKNEKNGKDGKGFENVLHDKNAGSHENDEEKVEDAEQKDNSIFETGNQNTEDFKDISGNNKQVAGSEIAAKFNDAKKSDVLARNENDASDLSDFLKKDSFRDKTVDNVTVSAGTGHTFDYKQTAKQGETEAKETDSSEKDGSYNRAKSEPDAASKEEDCTNDKIVDRSFKDAAAGGLEVDTNLEVDSNLEADSSDSSSEIVAKTDYQNMETTTKQSDDTQQFKEEDKKAGAERPKRVRTRSLSDYETRQKNDGCKRRKSTADSDSSEASHVVLTRSKKKQTGSPAKRLRSSRH